MVTKCEDVLKSRFKKVLEVGIYKKQRGIPPLDEKRWKEVLTRIKLLGRQQGIPEYFIEDIWEKIHQKALVLEEGITSTTNKELNLESIRNEINEIDKALVEIIGDIYTKEGEEKTLHAITTILEKIRQVL